MESNTEKSKELAFLLRHDTNYSFDPHGWRLVSDLVANHGFTTELLVSIVTTDKKGRYEFNEDHSKIRACQGHSINVDVDLEELTPPDILYHGTATRFLESIFDDGIKKMSRNYVHLTTSWLSAQNTGVRHGHPVVITIDAKQMTADGQKFYKSHNDVWLTERVDPKYFIMVTDKYFDIKNRS